MLRSQPQGRRGPLIVVPLETPAGIFTAHFSESGLARLDFPSEASAPFSAGSMSLPPLIRKWTRLTREAVLRILSGKAVEALPPLDLSAGTSFQQRVWSALRRIGPGETRSYLEVATAIGNPKATRAVGGACGANPIPLLIPCHRVLASGHKLGGFSGGLAWKKRLLMVEAKPISSRPDGAGEMIPRQGSLAFDH
jgi:O-6-methylguanine DNA methyltransferase